MLRAAAWCLALGSSCVLPQVRAQALDAAEPQGELTLSQAIAAALARNPELEGAGYELRAAEAGVVQAGLRPNPELAAGFENFGGSGVARGTQILESTLSLSQVIELGGKRRQRVAVAGAGRDAAAASRDLRQLDLLAEVTQRFIEVASAQEQAGLARRARELAEETLAAIERRVDAARSPLAERSRARIATSRARLAEQRAGLALDNARRQLAAQWGSATPAFSAVHADLFELPAVEELAVLLQRLRANPDFLRLAAEGRLRAAELRLAQAQARPNLQVGAGVRRFEDSGDAALVLNFSLALPLSDRNQGAIAEAEAKRDLAGAGERAALIKAQVTLSGLYRELRLAQDETQTLRGQMVPQAREALAQTRDGYERGRFSYLELADALRELNEVQGNAIEAAASYHRLRAEIERLGSEPLARAAR